MRSRDIGYIHTILLLAYSRPQSYYLIGGPGSFKTGVLTREMKIVQLHKVHSMT